MRNALVVAHPDDEVLWFGGLMIAEPGDWHIFCATTPRADPERATKIVTAGLLLGAASISVSPLVEPFASQPLDRLDERVPDLASFDRIVTHNVVGEYGHLHHGSLHRLIKGRWPDRIVTGGYGMAAKPKIITLTDCQYARKIEALKAYDHVSPTDGKPKWQALLERYGTCYDLRTETYDR